MTNLLFAFFSILFLFCCSEPDPSGENDADLADAETTDSDTTDAETTDSDTDTPDGSDPECSEIETERPELFAEILDHLVQHEVSKQGDWQEDFGDATCYAPPVLIEVGEAQCDQPLSDLGWETVEREYDLLDNFMESPDEALIGGLGLVLVYSLTEDETVAEQARTMIVLAENALALVGENGLLPQLYSGAYGQTAATAIVAAIFLLYLDRIDDEDTFVREEAFEIISNIESATYDPKGFYRHSPDDEQLYLYPNVAMMLVHSLAHRFTGEQAHVDRAESLFQAIEPLWIEKFGTYRSPYRGTPIENYVSLSSQNYLSLALMFLFDETTDQTYLDQAQRTVDFIETRLYEEGIVYHHHENGKRSGWYCTGCNFQFLFVLRQLDLRL